MRMRRLNTKCVVCCSVLQCVAVCCSVLQCVAVCCSVLQCVAPLMAACTNDVCVVVGSIPNAAIELTFENKSMTRTRDVCTYVQETSKPD